MVTCNTVVVNKKNIDCNGFAIVIFVARATKIALLLLLFKFTFPRECEEKQRENI